MKLCICIPALVLFLYSCVQAAQIDFSNEDELNLYCLRQAYPQITGLAGEGGKSWLTLANGDKVLYADPLSQASDPLDTDVKNSMALPYQLEPARDLTGQSPGRHRSYDLFRALYGHDKTQVSGNLVSHNFLGKNIKLAPNAAQAFEKAIPRLEALAASEPQYRHLLKPEGGYYWRNIAGENVLSAHSFGVALDLGADTAPYWRWSRQMPHPMQRTYPPEIVEIMENEGFIWGGKWHEYDLMHFEYRPELICKARLSRQLNQDPQ